VPTPRGDHFKEQIIHAFHDGFCHKPEQFTDAEFAVTAKSFHNPDWVATTLNCYRTW
jgi:hypothetical protein